MLMTTERMARVVARMARRRGLTAKAVEDIGGWFTLAKDEHGEFPIFGLDDYRAWLRS